MKSNRQEYDYVVVGGGTAGGVLASRLPEDADLRVLLVEAGSQEPPAALRQPGAWLTLLGGAAVWADSGMVNGFSGAPIATPRGRTLEGSSSINGLSFLRGHRTSYDRWPHEGAAGCGFDDPLPYFRRSETAKGRDATIRGLDGPLIFNPPAHPNPLAAAMVQSAVDAGYSNANDLSSGLEIGLAWPDANIVNGARQSAADAYLAPGLALMG